MVEDRVTDGRRIAELLASELDGREDGALEALAVVNADRDVEPTEDGALAYEVERRDADDEDGELLGGVYVHPDRIHVELREDVEDVAQAAREAGLRTRPKAVRPPRVLVFVESGAEVKRFANAFEHI
ncbi:hypothetical protein [Halomicrococcus sp. SG-WS-1]|uniref:hypothetical protein n=1 Tax=Halomicrococcus sp. SG-WS-1 TaxID=3439057 RepID=UPI003F79A17E